MPVSVGEKYARLTVLGTVKRNMTSKTKTFARCICECGNETVVEPSKLTRGKTRSCGCSRDNARRSDDHKRAVKRANDLRRTELRRAERAARLAAEPPKPEPVVEPPPTRKSKHKWHTIAMKMLRQYVEHEEIRGCKPTPGGTLDNDPEVARFMREHGVTRIEVKRETA